MRLPRWLYEALPVLYLLAGLAALSGGYLLHSGWASTLLSLVGLTSALGGVVVWLRRRDFRSSSAEYQRTRGERDSDRLG